MTREQAINYLISSGFSDEQVSEVVRALTYEPTTKNDLGVERHKQNIQAYAHDFDVSEEQAEKELAIKPMVEIDLYSVIKQKYIEREVLDKIRAEIKKQQCGYMGGTDYEEGVRFGLMLAHQILDKSKAETEEG